MSNISNYISDLLYTLFSDLVKSCAQKHKIPISSDDICTFWNSQEASSLGVSQKQNNSVIDSIKDIYTRLDTKSELSDVETMIKKNFQNLIADIDSSEQIVEITNDSKQIIEIIDDDDNVEEDTIDMEDIDIIISDDEINFSEEKENLSRNKHISGRCVHRLLRGNRPFTICNEKVSDRSHTKSYCTRHLHHENKAVSDSKPTIIQEPTAITIKKIDSVIIFISPPALCYNIQKVMLSSVKKIAMVNSSN